MRGRREREKMCEQMVNRREGEGRVDRRENVRGGSTEERM